MKKIFLIFCSFFALSAEEWTTMPSNINLNSGDNKTINVNAKYFYNRNNFVYSTAGSGISQLTIQAAPGAFFYNEGKINVGANSKLISNFQSFLMERSTYNILKNGIFQANGKEFTIYSGSFFNYGDSTLALSSSFNNNSPNIINSGGKFTINTDTFNNGNQANGKGSYGVFETNQKGITTINATEINNFGYTYDVFENKISDASNAKLNAISILKSTSSSQLNLNGGDVYNGVGFTPPTGPKVYSSGAGYIIADNSTINIQKTLISQGSGKGLSTSDAAYIVKSKIEAINGGIINIAGSFENREYSDVYVNNSGAINITGDFKNAINTNIYFSGNASGYGKITANTIDVRNSKLIFYKGSANTNMSYTVLNASSSLVFNTSILGTQDVVSEDGSINIFYKASIVKNGNQLQITFQDKSPPPSTGGGSTSPPPSTGGGSTPPPPPTPPPSGDGGTAGDSKPNDSASDILSKYTSLNKNESIIIDAIDKQKPIAGFDIRNMGVEQIKNLATDIQTGFKNFIDNQNKASRLNFDINKTIIFGRMAKIQSKNRLNISSYEAYAANTIQNPYENTACMRYYCASPAPVFKEKDLKNAVYVGLLGAYENNTSGLGYAYGINGGYDKIVNENLFLGVYASYIGGGTKLDFSNTQTQSFQIGGYGSVNTGIFESDVIVGYNYAFNKTNRSVSILSNTYSNRARYNTHSVNILAQSGPKFNFESHTIKPFLGIVFNMDFKNPITENSSPLSSRYDFQNDLYVSGMAGLEYQKYISDGYFFIRPTIEYTFYSNLKSTQIVFLNSSIFIPAPSKENFASVMIGGEIPINKRFFINMNAIGKISNQQTFITAATASVKFMF